VFRVDDGIAARARTGALIAATGAAALLALMFADWYGPVREGILELGPQAGRPQPPPPASAWEAFAVVDVLLLLTVVLGAATVALVSVRGAGARPGTLSGVTSGFGAVMALVVFYRLIDPPGDEAVVAVRPGAYLGLAATAAIALGAYLVLCQGRPPLRLPGPISTFAVGDEVGRLGGARVVAGVTAALVVAYLVTRVWFVDGFPYFFDEGTYATFTYEAAGSLSDLFLSFSIGREPLQIWLGVPLVEVGVGPLTAMRVVSVGAGLLTVLVVGLLGWRFGGGLVGLVAGGLCVVLPFFVVHDGIGIMEPLVTLVMAGALLLQLELARRPDWRVAVLLGLVLAAGVLLKENTKPALALVPLSLLCFDWSAGGRRRRLVVWVLGVGLAAVMVVAAELVLRSSSRYEQLLEFREGVFYTVRSLGDALAQPGVGWDATWPVYRPALVGYVTLPLLGAALAGALLGLWRRPRPTLLLLAWVAVPFAVAVLFTTLPFPRHIMYVLPPAIVLMAYALVQAASWLARTLPAPAAAPAIIAAACLLLAPALRFDARVLADPATTRYPTNDDRQYVTGTTAGEIWPAVADAIRERARGRQVVILHPTADSNIIRFMLGTESRYEVVPGGSTLAPRAQFALYDQSTGFVDGAAHSLARARGFVPVRRFSRPRGGAVLTLYAPPRGERPPFTLARETIRWSTGRPIRIVPGVVDGGLRRTRAGRDRASFTGWAANLRRPRPAAFLLAFSGGEFLAAVPPTVDRPDIASRTGEGTLQQSGYAFELPLARNLQVFAVEGGVASPLPIR
jgi:4-amino-4-deoxy-L-arabinose transferase-like glycosyltransferase